MKHNASIIGEYTGILLINQCHQKGIFNFERLFWKKARWCFARLHLSIAYAPIQLQIELLELAVIIKCTIYTNVLIKAIKFVVELGHN